MSDWDLGVKLPQPRSPYHPRTPGHIATHARWHVADTDETLEWSDEDGHLVAVIDYYNQDRDPLEWVEIHWRFEDGTTGSGKARSTSPAATGNVFHSDRVYSKWSLDGYGPFLDDIDEWPEDDRALYYSSLH